MEDKEIKIGQTVSVEGKVDAMRTGLNHGAEARIIIDGVAVWVNLEKLKRTE